VAVLVVPVAVVFLEVVGLAVELQVFVFPLLRIFFEVIYARNFHRISLLRLSNFHILDSKAN